MSVGVRFRRLCVPNTRGRRSGTDAGMVSMSAGVGLAAGLRLPAAASGAWCQLLPAMRTGRKVAAKSWKRWKLAAHALSGVDQYRA